MTDTDPFADPDRTIQIEDDDPEHLAGEEVNYNFNDDPDEGG